MRRLPFLAVAMSFLVFASVTTGCADDSSSSTEDSEIRARPTDKTARAAIERAAKDAVFVSEADYPYVWADAKLARGEKVTPELVIAKLGHLVENKDGAKLHAVESSYKEFWSYDDCTENSYPGPDECAKDKLLDQALKANLKDLKIFYVAPHENPDGDGVPTIMILGTTPEGNLGGVWTVAVWT